jgi:RNA polymerase sigma factor (sigma-70 family)
VNTATAPPHAAATEDLPIDASVGERVLTRRPGRGDRLPSQAADAKPIPQNRSHGGDAILTAYASYLVGFKARQIVRRSGFTPSDREDVEHDLWLALASQAEHFDPSRASLNTFTDRVIESAAAMILRKRRQKKRAAGFHALSLDAAGASEVTEGGSGAGVSADDLARRIGVNVRNEISCREHADAVHHALARMPEDVREVCRHLMGGTISSAARDLRITRRQVRKHLASARVFLERAGFGEN